ncbi:MAG TPA: TraR/DksA family transcriptional regulator [Jatrophihabitantaceae bacterium]|nr:TraR/DksA family transcriptional regulator [Jatrophihabitantaceae bacterium]
MTQSAIRPNSGGGSSGATLSAAELAGLRDLLEQQRRFRLEQLEQLQTTEAPGELSNGDREITDSLVAGARAALRDVVDALQRMDDGRYGSCRRCGTTLEPARLEVLPQVSLCVTCQRADQDG